MSVFAIAIKKPPIRGELWAWGWNDDGQLGLGDTTYRSSPEQVGAEVEWTQAVASWEGGLHLNSDEHGVAVKLDGTLWCWGNNNQGQLGQGDLIDRSSPVQVGSDTNWSTVGTGSSCTWAVRTDGTLWAWGDNTLGQLAQGDSGNGTHKSSPVQIGSDTNWKSVSGDGTGSGFAIKTNGEMWAWGNNQYGQLGQEDLVRRSSPVQVGALTNWDKMGVGNTHFLSVIKTDGTLWAWGYNQYYNLGLGDNTHRSSPVQVGSATNWTVITGGYRSSMGITTDGKLWTWGWNNFGELGLGDLVTRSLPTQVGALTDWYRVSSGNYIGVATKTDGTLWTWGYNAQGQLGQGDLVYRSSPTQVGAETGWKLVNTKRSGSTFVIKEV